MASQDNTASSDHLGSPNVLDEAHQRALERAVGNILETELAERTYGQILDGLPTEESINESHSWVEDHPVHTMPHTEICPGYVDQARQFRAAFNIAELRFQMKVRVNLVVVIYLFPNRHSSLSTPSIMQR